MWHNLGHFLVFVQPICHRLFDAFKPHKYRIHELGMTAFLHPYFTHDLMLKINWHKIRDHRQGSRLTIDALWDLKILPLKITTNAAIHTLYISLSTRDLRSWDLAISVITYPLLRSWCTLFDDRYVTLFICGSLILYRGMNADLFIKDQRSHVLRSSKILRS